MTRALSAVLFLTLAGCATAQPTTPPTPAPAHAAPTAGRPAALAVEAANDAERAVQEMIAGDGVHVVHFWAPWCDNSISELSQGWYEVIEDNPEVNVAFVTVWSDGADGADVLQRYAIPDRVLVLTQSDGRAEALRRREFLGLPMTWLPSTWVFHENGRLAFAFNYGEMTMPQLQAAIDAAARDW